MVGRGVAALLLLFCIGAGVVTFAHQALTETAAAAALNTARESRRLDLLQRPQQQSSNQRRRRQALRAVLRRRRKHAQPGADAGPDPLQRKSARGTGPKSGVIMTSINGVPVHVSPVAGMDAAASAKTSGGGELSGALAARDRLGSAAAGVAELRLPAHGVTGPVYEMVGAGIRIQPATAPPPPADTALRNPDAVGEVLVNIEHDERQRMPHKHHHWCDLAGVWVNDEGSLLLTLGFPSADKTLISGYLSQVSVNMTPRDNERRRRRATDRRGRAAPAAAPAAAVLQPAAPKPAAPLPAACAAATQPAAPAAAAAQPAAPAAAAAQPAAPGQLPAARAAVPAHRRVVPAAAAPMGLPVAGAPAALVGLPAAPLQLAVAEAADAPAAPVAPGALLSLVGMVPVQDATAPVAPMVASRRRRREEMTVLASVNTSDAAAATPRPPPQFAAPGVGTSGIPASLTNRTALQGSAVTRAGPFAVVTRHGAGAVGSMVGQCQQCGGLDTIVAQFFSVSEVYTCIDAMWNRKTIHLMFRKWGDRHKPRKSHEPQMLETEVVIKQRDRGGHHRPPPPPPPPRHREMVQLSEEISANYLRRRRRRRRRAPRGVRER